MEGLIDIIIIDQKNKLLRKFEEVLH